MQQARFRINSIRDAPIRNDMPVESTPDNHRPDRSFIEMFDNFLRRGIMASTYKAVFLRSLVDIGRYGDNDLVGKQWIRQDDGKIKLDLDFIAIRFIKYYWDMEIAFKMRHMPERMADHNHPKKDVLIVELIREKMGEMRRQEVMRKLKSMPLDIVNNPTRASQEIECVLRLPNPPTMENLASDEMKEFRTDVVKRAIRPEVLRKILKDMPDLYQIVNRENYILLDAGIVDFMKEFSRVVKKALNYVLAIHLEKHNPSARHIATKIDDEANYDTILQRVKSLQMKMEQKPSGESEQDGITDTPDLNSKRGWDDP